MSPLESAVLAELSRRLRLTREDPARSEELARWSDDMAVVGELDGGDVRDLVVEIACQWENTLSAAHESEDPEGLMHLRFDDASLADWLSRAVALFRSG